jgi:hypothetical protein
MGSRALRTSFFWLFALLFNKRNRENKKHKKMNIKLDGSEASMIPQIVGRASQLLGDTAISFQEFSVGRGIADLYIVSKDAVGYEARQRANIPAITDKQQNEIVNLLWANEGLSFGEVGELLRGKRITNIDSNLQSLLDFKALYVEDGRVYVKMPPTGTVIGYSVAIEAKVSDWRGGVKQALRYKNFADKSYLALYESHIKIARQNIKVFETLNIGLIGVSDEDINVYYDPLENKKDDLKYKLASERVYSLIDDTQDSFIAGNNFITSGSAA